MQNQTFPNQRTVIVYREAVKTDFLGISNANWQAAARDLGAHAFLLYIYLACNKDGFNLALSQADVLQTIGMPRSTYHDQFHRLVAKGYLVNTHGNTYAFFEKPQPRDVSQQKNDKLSDGQQNPANDIEPPQVAQNNLQGSIEININTETDNETNNNINELEKYIPKVKEITIPIPQREGKNDKFIRPKKGEFIF
ncbi:MAG: hypothetical protein IJY93_04955 [Clostridia bacterium]|nr:hypothetical protein [Clostridia bacterium]